MTTVAAKIGAKLTRALAQSATAKGRLRKYRKVARRKLEQLSQTMRNLAPQIRYWLKTGWVAKDKIISLHIPELYSIVRGKVGKAVEFGLHWGITWLRGGFLIATLSKNKHELHDSRFALRAVEDHKARFGEAPRAYAYDRAGWSGRAPAAPLLAARPRGTPPGAAQPRSARQRVMTPPNFRADGS